MSVFVLLPIELSLCYSFLSIYSMPYCFSFFHFSWTWSLLNTVCGRIVFTKIGQLLFSSLFKYFACLPFSFLSLAITCLLGCLKFSHWRLMPLLKTLFLSLCFIFLLLCIQAHQSNELVYTVVL